MFSYPLAASRISDLESSEQKLRVIYCSVTVVYALHQKAVKFYSFYDETIYIIKLYMNFYGLTILNKEYKI